MNDYASTPSLRIRINHSKTIKEGWGFDTTVELTAPLEMSLTEREQALSAWLLVARTLGEEERDIRNARDQERKDTPNG